MPRTSREATGGVCCHVLNRGNARQRVFHDDEDYAAFVELIELACARAPMRVLAWCLMPNHFHLILQPPGDGDLAAWMQWLMTSHVRRHHRRHASSGHVWQGRFKSFPIQHRRPRADERARGVVEKGDSLWAAVRYVERNPLRANLVRRAEDWAWSSLARWAKGGPGAWNEPAWFVRPHDWIDQVAQPQSDAELSAVRRSVQRGTPLGEPAWIKRAAARLGLEHTLRPRGRPRKHRPDVNAVPKK